MKKVITFLFTSLLISCGSMCSKSTDNSVAVSDTIYVEVLVADTVRIKELEADVAFWKDSVKLYKETIPFDVYMNARKIEKIKYYIQITERNGNNRAFFYGWIKRTMAD